MRILALDPGTKRVGVAISDETRTLATPLEFIPAEPFAEFLARLKTLIREKEVGLVLVGVPRNMDGSFGPAAAQAQQFVAVLKEALTVPIHTVDERLSTVQAQRLLRAAGRRARKQKTRIDQSAAAVLLQSYLDTLGG
ncbi:MAG: Holliday junction resolvase RuvX [Verrucomicrobiae bacterium]|nr:Holliday junction resolvase RuvX [Verrucomicrobiae bacterium]